MKLLVLAQIPPPVHGQSVMVQALVAGLPAHGITVHHVNLGLSRDASDIGRGRPGKVFPLLAACFRAVVTRIRDGCDTLYYVPAPGVRSAVYRDWIVMALCRPFFRQLVLHWHGGGLQDWLLNRATWPERFLTYRLLGGATLSIILTDKLSIDALAFAPRRVATVPNGVPDPGQPSSRPPPNGRPYQVLFLGLCSEEKGCFDAAQAVLAANGMPDTIPATPEFTLVAAGPFPDAATERRFAALCAAHPAFIRHAGIVSGEAKERLLRESNCLCLPSLYPAEGQPLVLLEAMARDLPIVATDWGGISQTVPAGTPLAMAGILGSLVETLVQVRRQPPAPGTLRKHYEENFTPERHLAALAQALRGLAGDSA